MCEHYPLLFGAMKSPYSLALQTYGMFLNLQYRSAIIFILPLELR